MDELIYRSKKGDEKAFTELILIIKSDLYRIAKTRLNNDYDINDAIQETIIKSYKHIKKLKENNKFKSWIIKILINECNKVYKRKNNTHKIIEKITNDKSFSIEDDLIQESNSKIDFEILINHLNYEEKLIITLFYNSMYTCNEIAEILNLNVNTVKSKLFRAKEKIRKNYRGGVIYE